MKIFIFMGTLTKNLLFLLYIYALPIHFFYLHIYLRLTAWLPMHWYMYLVLIHITAFLVLTKKITNILLWNYIHNTYMYYWIFWLELKFTFILFPEPTLRLAKISLSSTNNFEAWKVVSEVCSNTLDMVVNPKKPDDFVHELPYKCYSIWPLVLWPYPEDFEKLAYSEKFL